MRQKVYEIPGKLVVEWEPAVKAIIDTWENQFITLKEFKNAIYIKGIQFAEENRGKAWIVNSLHAKSVFRPEIQDFISAKVFPKFKKIGVKYFITIKPVDLVAKITVEKYKAKTGQAGLILVECDSTRDAIDWLKKND